MMLLGVALVCSLGLLAGASVLVVKCVRATGARSLAPSMRLILVGLAAIYLVGIWWGVPWGWAPDEIPPWFFLDAIDRHFAAGWHDKYPPMLFYLNAVLYLPFVVLARPGWLDLSTNASQAVLLVVSRLLSTVMAIGTVWAIS